MAHSRPPHSFSRLLQVTSGSGGKSTYRPNKVDPNLPQQASYQDKKKTQAKLRQDEFDIHFSYLDYERLFEARERSGGEK